MVVDVKIYFNTTPIIKKPRKLCINFMRDNTSKSFKQSLKLSLNAEHTPKIGKRFGLHTLRAAFLGLLPVLCSYMGSVLFTVFFDYSFSPEMGSLEIVEIFSIDLQERRSQEELQGLRDLYANNSELLEKNLALCQERHDKMLSSIDYTFKEIYKENRITSESSPEI